MLKSAHREPIRQPRNNSDAAPMVGALTSTHYSWMFDIRVVSCVCPNLVQDRLGVWHVFRLAQRPVLA